MSRWIDNFPPEAEGMGTTDPDTSTEDDSIVNQSPARRIGDHVFVSIPGPVAVVSMGACDAIDDEALPKSGEGDVDRY